MKLIDISISESLLILLILFPVALILAISIYINSITTNYQSIINQQQVTIECYQDKFSKCKDQLGVFYKEE